MLNGLLEFQLAAACVKYESARLYCKLDYAFSAIGLDVDFQTEN